MKNKILTLLLTIGLLVPLQGAKAFNDVYLDHPYYQAIKYYEGLGLIEGYPSGAFLSEEKINRVEVLKMILNIKAVDLEEASETDLNFIDVDTDEWYGPFLKYAAQNEYVQGYPDQTFRPTNTVTLAETLSILFQVYEKPIDKTTPQDWYKPYMEAAGQMELLDQLSATEPHQALTRGEVLSMIYQLDTGEIASPYLELKQPYTPQTLEFISQEMGLATEQMAYEFARLHQMVKDKIYNDYLIPVETHLQERALSCEIASLKTVLDYYGNGDSEAALFEKLSKATPYEYDEENNVWGNPHEGFVGSVDGSQLSKTGYGVYWEPIAEVGQVYMPGTQAFSQWGLNQLLYTLIEGKPVVIWGYTYAQGGFVDLSWETPEGEEILAYNGEHTFTVIGFKGNIQAPTDIVLIDPLKGRVTWKTDYFLENWSTFQNSGVLVDFEQELLEEDI